MAMPALAAVLWTSTSSPRGPLVRLALGALGLSWLGDSAPRLAPESLSFLVMVAFFLGAQVVYALAFWPYRHRCLLTRPVLATPYLLAAAAIVLVCAPSAGVLLPAIAVYSAAIVMMAVLASGLGRLGTVGGAVFVVSDSLIALDVFGVLTLPAQGFWVMITYLLAQLLLMLAVRGAAAEDRIPRG
nr:lysoplasmalogenase [Brachybacterium sacelli]